MKSVLALATVLVALLAVQEAHPHAVGIVEVPADNVVAPPASDSAPYPGDSSSDEDGVEDTASTVQLTVLRKDVEAVRRYIRAHYTRMWLGVPSRTLVAVAAAVECNPDGCYSDCYLQGFQSGKCKDGKCFCTQNSIPNGIPR